MPKIKYIKSKKRPSIKFKKGGKKTKTSIGWGPRKAYR